MIQLDGIKAVIFDLDGLMIESESIGYQVWRQVVAEFGSEMSEALYREFIGKTPEATIDLVCEILGLSISPQDLSERYWRQRTETMCVEAQAVEGLVTLIEDLHQHHVPLGVASNSPTDYVERVLEALQLRQRFQAVIGSDQVPEGKPAPDVYLATAAALTVDPQDCLAIEDSPTGLQAALNAGMRCLVVPNENLEGDDFSGAEGLYNSLSEVLAALS
ncbi:MAG: HAD family phosphatase [Anaerolineales bacterium]|nr:MAG: HAD family phosphatase [Anaerolineales bacterium]